jgi:hypothetical protein
VATAAATVPPAPAAPPRGTELIEIDKLNKKEPLDISNDDGKRYDEIYNKTAAKKI